MSSCTNRHRRVTGLCATLACLAIAVGLSGAAPAQGAASGWRVLAVSGPTNLPPVNSEVQKASVDATGGTFTLSFEGQTTVSIPYDADPWAVKVALDALPTIGGAGAFVEVGGGPGGLEAATPYGVRFRGSLAATDVPQLVADGTLLTGGAGTATVSTTIQGGTPGQGTLVVYATNVGGAATAGTTTLTIGPLPAGIETAGPAFSVNSSEPYGNWECLPTGAGASTVTCTLAASVPAMTMPQTLGVPLRVQTSAPLSSTVPVKVESPGAVSDTYDAALTVSEAPVQPGVQAVWAGAFDENGAPATEAGAHPNLAATLFFVNTNINPLGVPIPAGDLRDMYVDLPPGFVANPIVTERCPQTELSCGNPNTEVGESLPFGTKFPPEVSRAPSVVYNDVPAEGYAAQFTFQVFETKASLLGSLRSSDDYGVTGSVPNIAQEVKIYGNYFRFEGNAPAAAGKALLTNPTDCANEAVVAPITRFHSNSWQQPTLFDDTVAGIPPVVNCSALDFTPEFAFRPSANSGSTPVATTARLHVDQARLLEPDKLAQPHLKDSVVTLPEGLNLNPSAANGLAACTTSQIGFKGSGFPMPNPTRFDEEPVSCPDASKLGTAEIESPLLEDPLEGAVYLAKQGDNPFDSLIALYIVVEDERTGITVKLPGRVTPNPSTGQLAAEFDNNPQVPFEELKLNFRGGGPRSTLATPDVCGTYETKGSWTPWSAPESGPPAQTTDSFEVSGNCAPSKAQRPFDIGLDAGATDPVAGKHSPFTLRLTRPDGNQEFDTVEAAMPPGFTATLKGVATCSDAQLGRALARNNPGDGKAEIASPSCPGSSQIGTTTIGAGVGPQPIYVDGKAYLTGPYKGAPLSLAFVVPAVAGPFDLGVRVVRTALNVDPKTAQITAVSDPVPQILSGIPVQIKDVRVNIDRDAFTLNPTSCEEMQIDAKVSGGSGATANLSNRFQVGDCAALGFEPRTNVRLFGGIARGKYQGVRAVVRPRPGDANISRTVVRFPRSAFVAQEHLKDICTRVQYAADACPKRSVYGRAIAYSPLLDEPLKGNVYLRSSDNALPDLVADLRGPAHQPIRVEVAVRNDSVKGALRNTVQAVPDAPVSYFRLQTFGKAKGLIVNSRNICKGKNQARVVMAAHNGRRSVQKVNVFNKRCKAYKRKLRKAKRAGHRSRVGVARRSRH